MEKDDQSISTDDRQGKRALIAFHRLVDVLKEMGFSDTETNELVDYILNKWHK